MMTTIGRQARMLDYGSFIRHLFLTHYASMESSVNVDGIRFKRNIYFQLHTSQGRPSQTAVLK